MSRLKRSYKRCHAGMWPAHLSVVQHRWRIGDKSDADVFPCHCCGARYDALNHNRVCAELLGCGEQCAVLRDEGVAELHAAALSENGKGAEGNQRDEIHGQGRHRHNAQQRPALRWELRALRDR